MDCSLFSLISPCPGPVVGPWLVILICLTITRTAARRITNGTRARLLQLEEILREHNIEPPPPPPPPPGDRGAADKGSGGQDAPHRSANTTTQSISLGSGSGSALSPSSRLSSAAAATGHCRLSGGSPDVTGAAADYPGVSPLETGHGDMSAGGQPLLMPQACSPPRSYFSRSTPESDSYASDGDISSVLAARVGSLQLAEDGQLRYYGPTSNLNVRHNGFQSLSRSTIRHVATEGREVLARLGLDQPVPEQLERHLARLYFAWEDPVIHVVDEDTFFEEKERWRSGATDCPYYYSETLNNAM